VAFLQENNSDRVQECLVNALLCEQRAASAINPTAQATFAEAAWCWREIASSCWRELSQDA